VRREATPAYPGGIEANGERLWDALMRSAEIGARRPGGLSRLALSDADREMRDQFTTWCRDAGCTVEFDRIGNIFARRAGMDESQPAVSVGSHLDTQVVGGRFDGVLGVLAGVEILRTLNAHRIQTRRAIEVISWTNEEGARFRPFMMGSAAFAGVARLGDLLNSRDENGVRVAEELHRIGYAGRAPVGRRHLDSYFELHIEQGADLDSSGIDVGVVVGGHRVRGMRVEIHGQTAHSGPTPMEKRRNALVGAALVAAAANDIGWHYAPLGRSSATQLKVWPNCTGILAEFAELTLDFRHPEPAISERMASEMEAALTECRTRARVEINIAHQWEFGVEFDPECVALVETIAARLEIPARRMQSFTGHDAYYVSRVAPTAMIFSPCREGITHNESENIELARTMPSVNVLLHTVLAQANR
jgi:N-carbamoyl-L-amino-acid hydrolase